MALSISNTRKAVVVDYSDSITDIHGDRISVRAINTSTGGVGERNEGNNDGEAVLFYPADFTGEDEVTITGSDGGEVTGIVEIS